MLTLALGIGFLLAVPAAQAQIAYGNDDSFASSAIRGLGDRAQMQAMPVASSGSWASASASAGGAPSFDIAARQMQQVNPAGGLFGGGGGLFNAGGLLNGVTSGIGSMGATASALASGGRAAAPGGSIFNLGGMGNGISQLIQMPGRVVVGAASGAAAATGGAGGTGLINSLVNSFLVRSPARVGAGGASASALPLLQIANPLTAQLFPVRQAPRRSECVVFTPGFSESLEQVSGRLGIPTAQLLADNVASVSAASEPLLGRNILVCGLQQARPVAAPPAPTRAPAPPGVPAPAPAAPPTLMPAPAPAPAPVTPGKQLLAPKQKQEAALLAFKAALDPKGQVLNDWDPSKASYCKWINVICDSAGNVIRLTLSYIGLEGNLPPASALADLPGLKGLLLGGNAIKGSLPAGYGESTSLQELYLNDNQLSGSLPAGWSQGKNLREISLAFNNLDGKLPAEWGALERLEVLKVNSNKLSGPVPKAWAPPSQPHMARLKALTIFGNADLSGCLPASLAAKGPGGKGLFQAPSGELTSVAKQAAAGTKITGFC